MLYGTCFSKILFSVKINLFIQTLSRYFKYHFTIRNTVFLLSFILTAKTTKMAQRIAKALRLFANSLAFFAVSFSQENCKKLNRCERCDRRGLKLFEEKNFKFSNGTAAMFIRINGRCSE